MILKLNNPILNIKFNNAEHTVQNLPTNERIHSFGGWTTPNGSTTKEARVPKVISVNYSKCGVSFILLFKQVFMVYHMVSLKKMV